MRDGNDNQTLDISGGFRIGYARVSTIDQNQDLQLDALKNAGCNTVYHEKVSGKKSDREELQNALKALRSGDTLVVWKLNRLGRNLSHLIEILNDLEKRGIAFESLTEAIETKTPAGRLMTNILAVLAQYELDVNRERTLAGLKAARARGRHGGRKPSLTKSAVEEIKVLYESRKFTVNDIAKRYSVSRQTIYNFVK